MLSFPWYRYRIDTFGVILCLIHKTRSSCLIVAAETALAFLCRHLLLPDQGRCHIRPASPPYVRPCLPGICSGGHAVIRSCTAGSRCQVYPSFDVTEHGGVLVEQYHINCTQVRQCCFTFTDLQVDLLLRSTRRVGSTRYFPVISMGHPYGFPQVSRSVQRGCLWQMYTVWTQALSSEVFVL